MIDAVSHYLKNILTPALLRYGVAQSFVIYTAETIAMQMNSLLYHWKDNSFRKTVLFLGLEEGSFYEPAVKTDIRCFVVVTLRNSPVEVLQSDAYQEAGLKKELSNKEVKEITSAAVQYFSRQNFEEMCKQADISNGRDLYAELKESILSLGQRFKMRPSVLQRP